MNSKRFFISFCLLTTFSLVSGSLNASFLQDEPEKKTSKARVSSSAEKTEEDSFESYTIKLKHFSSTKAPFSLSFKELCSLLEAKKTDSNEVLAQDKKNVHKIQFICAKQIFSKDLKEGDQIVPLLDSQALSAVETVDIPYVVMHGPQMVFNFRLLAHTQSKEEFLKKKKSKEKINANLKNKQKMLKLQAEHYADLLPAHFKRHLRSGETALAEFNPAMINRIPMKIFEAFLGDGIGSRGTGLYTNTFSLEGGYLLTFSSKTLHKLSMVEQTDLLSYLGYSLSKKKRRNGENGKISMTYHYELTKPSAVKVKKGVISDAIPTPPPPHFFDLTIKRIEETPDVSVTEPSLIQAHPVESPVRPSFARLKASSSAKVDAFSSGRPRSRSFSVKDVDFAEMDVEKEDLTIGDGSKSSALKETKTLVSSEFIEEKGGSEGSGDNSLFDAHGSLIDSLQMLSIAAGRGEIKPFKPRSNYKRASSVQNLKHKQVSNERVSSQPLSIGDVSLSEKATSSVEPQQSPSKKATRKHSIHNGQKPKDANSLTTADNEKLKAPEPND